MSENVRVIVRSRPLNKNEANQKVRVFQRSFLLSIYLIPLLSFLSQKILKIADLCVKLENEDPSVPAKSFTFDSVYDDKAPTEAIYNEICYPLVEVSTYTYNLNGK